ncbi:MAG: hypothetical protein J0I13_06085 [Rhizobiales bacterium]|nr:hypothetical protein [Hyphomicrobiales bacterium]
MSSAKFDPIAYLVQIKCDAQLPDVVLTRELVLEFEEQFRSLSPEQLRLRVRSQEYLDPIEQIQFDDLSEDSDLRGWGISPGWSIDEAVALSFGKRPDRVDWQTIQELAEFSNLARRYLERRDLVRRSATAALLPDPIPPAVFIWWAKRAGVVVPAKLVTAVQERALELAALKAGNEMTLAPITVESPGEAGPAQSPDSEKAVQELQREIVDLRNRLDDAESRIAIEKRSATREKNSILKLFIGLAATAYGYEPRGDGDKPTSEIVSDLAGVGLKIDPNTIRKYLKEGGDIFLGRGAE